MTETPEGCLSLVKAYSITRDDYYDYISDWKRSGEEIVPCQAIPHGNSFEDWLEYVRNCETGANTRNERLASVTYFMKSGFGGIIGAINIRPRLDAGAIRVGGHVGYGIRPSERGHGYASIMLKMAFPILKGLGVDRALITCDMKNAASAKTAVKCGGIMENMIIYNGALIQRYWIDITR